MAGLVKEGRPTKLTPELIELAHTYITQDEAGKWNWQCDEYDVVPTVEGLALYLGISRDSAYVYRDDSQEFSDIMSSLMGMQGKMLIGGSISNKFNPTISKLLLSSKHGYVEKTETDITSNGETVGQADPLVAAEFAAFMKKSTEQ